MDCFSTNITLNTSGAISSAHLIRKLVLCVYCIVSEYESCKGSVTEQFFLISNHHRIECPLEASRGKISGKAAENADGFSELKQLRKKHDSAEINDSNEVI